MRLVYNAVSLEIEYPTLLQEATKVAVTTMPNTFLYTVPRVIARAKNAPGGPPAPH